MLVGAINRAAGTTQVTSVAPRGASLTVRITSLRGRVSVMDGNGEYCCDHGLEAATVT